MPREAMSAADALGVLERCIRDTHYMPTDGSLNRAVGVSRAAVEVVEACRGWKPKTMPLDVYDAMQRLRAAERGDDEGD